MKIAFYCPLKPISHPTPSGDREIARGIYEFLEKKGANISILSEFRTKDFYRSWTGILGWLKELYKAYLRVKQDPPDCFFTYHLYYKAPDPIGSILALWFRKPYFVFEGMYAKKAARRFPFWLGYFFTRFALKRAHRIYSDKSSDFDFLKLHFKQEQIVYIPPSLDLQRFSKDRSWRTEAKIPAGVPIIVTVAMLRPDRKTEGVKFLIESLKEIETPFHWVMVGDGDCRREVEEIVRSLGWNNVTFLGKQPAEVVAKVLMSGDLFAFPGIDEGFGFVYVEAQAAGLPVVAFDNGGIPDAVARGKTGFLTKPFDRAEYVAKIRCLLEDKDLRNQMGQQGKEFVSAKFDRSKNYEIIWDDLVLLKK